MAIPNRSSLSCRTDSDRFSSALLASSASIARLRFKAFENISAMTLSRLIKSSVHNTRRFALTNDRAPTISYPTRNGTLAIDSIPLSSRYRLMRAVSSGWTCELEETKGSLVRPRLVHQGHGTGFESRGTDSVPSLLQVDVAVSCAPSCEASNNVMRSNLRNSATRPRLCSTLEVTCSSGRLMNVAERSDSNVSNASRSASDFSVSLFLARCQRSPKMASVSATSNKRPIKTYRLYSCQKLGGRLTTMLFGGKALSFSPQRCRARQSNI